MHLNTIPNQYYQYEKILQPSARCQLCLQHESFPKDFIVTCSLCRSSIHQTHYGFELLYGLTEKWMCERCREMIDKGPNHEILCTFCPSKRGIMLRINFQNETIWVHPECSGWWFPIYNYFNSKRDILRFNTSIMKNQCTFWFKILPQQPCSICNQIYGKPIKCMYYSCQKYFHVTCGKREGVVRDLESMRITTQVEGAYTPVYCRQHLEKRVTDFKYKSELAASNNQNEKAIYFSKLSTLYHIQLNNLINSASKYKFEEDLRLQMNNPNQATEEQDHQLTFSDLTQNYETHHSPQFINFLQQSLPFQHLHINQPSNLSFSHQNNPFIVANIPKDQNKQLNDIIIEEKDKNEVIIQQNVEIMRENN